VNVWSSTNCRGACTGKPAGGRRGLGRSASDHYSGDIARWKSGALVGSKKQAGSSQQAGAPRVGEESKLPDTNETSRQNVKRKPAKELARRQRHLALFVAVSIVSPAKGNVLTVECQQPMVADGNPVGVATEILKYLAGSAERGLGVDHPLLPKQ
jgi:hypothetical protein